MCTDEQNANELRIFEILLNLIRFQREHNGEMCMNTMANGKKHYMKWYYLITAHLAINDRTLSFKNHWMLSNENCMKIWLPLRGLPSYAMKVASKMNEMVKNKCLKLHRVGGG